MRSGSGCDDSDPEVHRVLTEKIFPRQGTVVTADQFVEASGRGQGLRYPGQQPALGYSATRASRPSRYGSKLFLDRVLARGGS